MRTGIKLNLVAPGALQAMKELEKYLSNTSVHKHHKGLIRILASQVNGCSFCLNMHLKEAEATGLPAQKILMLPVWKETDIIMTIVTINAWNRIAITTDLAPAV